MSLVAVLAAAAVVVAVGRPTAWFGDLVSGSGGRAGGASESEAAAAREAAARDAESRATLAAGGGTKGPSAPSVDGLPPPVDFATVDRETDLHGVVVDGADAPVEGAVLVTVTYPFDRASILAVDRDDEAVEGPRTRSAKDGTFSIRLRRGASVGLRVSAAGFAPVERKPSRAGERVRVVLRPGVSLVVVATAPGERPAARVEFSLTGRGDHGFRKTGTTGADGRVRFDELPAGVTASLQIEAGTWGWDEYSRSVRLPDVGEEAVSVALGAGRTITGRVTDAETSVPVRGARVGMGWWLGRAATTDADGRYALPGWTGNGIHDVHALAEGYGRAFAQVGTADVVDLALSRGDTVVGRVVGPDGRPLAGAVVAAVGTRFHGPEQVVSTASGTTGTDGRFGLGGLRHDLAHTLVVMPAGFGRTLVDFAPHAGGAGTVDLGDVVVPPGRTLSGSVVRHDGTPVADARLEMKGANADRGRLLEDPESRADVQDSHYGSTEETTSAADGRFAFVDLAPGTYEIDVWTPGMPSRNVTVRVGSEADPAPVEIRFAAGRSIRVTVVDDAGAPVPWAYLFVEGASGPHNTVTPLDAKGSASLLVPDSVTSLTVETWGGGGDDPRRFLEEGRDFPIDPKASEMRCVLTRGLVLSGRVVGPDGAPVARAGVQVRKGGEYVTSATTADDGTFDVTVAAGGPYSVVLDGRTGSYPRVKDSGLAGVVEDVAAGATDVLVRAHPAARDRKQTVRVVDPDGRPLAGAKVSAEWGSQVGKSAEAATDATGQAELTGLPEYPCSWKASPPPDASELVTTYGGEDSAPSPRAVEITMRRGLHVHGRVVVPEAASGQRVRLEVTQGSFQRQMRTLDPGTTAFSMWLDPRYGDSGTVAATVGPDGAPTHVARLEGVRLGEAELVLTLAPVR
jgi:protocatechuate 3,4-dioxygenase beta subunit